MGDPHLERNRFIDLWVVFKIDIKFQVGQAERRRIRRIQSENVSVANDKFRSHERIIVNVKDNVAEKTTILNLRSVIDINCVAEWPLDILVQKVKRVGSKTRRLHDFGNQVTSVDLSGETRVCDCDRTFWAHSAFARLSETSLNSDWPLTNMVVCIVRSHVDLTQLDVKSGWISRESSLNRINESTAYKR